GDKLDTYAKVFNNAVAKTKMVSAIKKDLETRFSEFVENDEMKLWVVHSHSLDNALKYKEEVQKAFPNIEVLGPLELSLSVACHIGPGALALATAKQYVSKK
ncbi:MAG: DegV family protein, partial [Clostridia bacterium]|nr:DegV family protein [Clostridia bacterium]